MRRARRPRTPGALGYTCTSTCPGTSLLKSSAGAGSYWLSTAGVWSVAANVPRGIGSSCWTATCCCMTDLNSLYTSRTLSTSPTTNASIAAFAIAFASANFSAAKRLTCSYRHFESAPRVVVASAAANEAEHDLAPGVLGDERRGRLDDVGVEAPAQPAVGRDHDEERASTSSRDLSFVQQRMRRRVDAGGQAVEHPLHLRCVRPRLLNPLLRAAELRRGDHLHRLRDLLRRFHRANAAPDVEKRGHVGAQAALRLAAN